MFPLSLLACCLVFAQSGDQRPTFRTSTELVSIDVNVAGGDGSPLEGLRPDQFEVFVDGKRRPVSHLEFIRSNRVATTAVGPVADNPYGGGRVVVLVVDQGSFPMAAQAAAREASTRVLNSVSPEDFLGLVAFPGRIAIAPTRDHAAVERAIGQIVGLRTDLMRSRFNLSAVEATQLKAKDSIATPEIIARECRGPYIDPVCRQEVIQDGGRLADGLEQQAVLSLSGLHGAMEALATVPGRKTAILISAGLPMRPGGFPNVDSETTAIARRAAAANVNLYVFYMNVHFLRFFSAEYGRRNNTLYDDMRLWGYGLEKFADVAGGSFAEVNVDADPFVERALRETSASYIVGIDVRPEDRDGKDHYIRVAVKSRGVTIRYRKIVNIPAK